MKVWDEHSRLAPLPAHPPLHQRTHDLLGALRLADERQHLRVRLLGITYPTWACASEHRKLAVAALALFELSYVFQESDMAREGRVKDMIEAEHVLAEHLDSMKDIRQTDGM